MSHDDALRDHVLAQLDSRQAHPTFDDVISEVPPALRGERPDRMPYSLWELLEHMRRGQADILAFCQNPDYTHPDWPGDYWPDAEAPPNGSAWTESIVAFRADLETVKDLVADSELDLYAEIPHGDGQTYLREALLVADHNAYHLGQMVVVRRLLDIWPPE